MKNYSIGKDIDSIRIDFIEQLVRSVVDTTVSKVVFKPKNNEGKPFEKQWNNAIKLIVKNNNIERLLKADVRQKSKHGKSYVGFDMFEDEPIIWVANYSPRNRSLRINGLEEYAVRVIRDYSTNDGSTPVLRNEVTYTADNKFYLFLGGFGVNGGANKIITKNTVKLAQKAFNSVSTSSFPWDYASIATPKYIVEQNKQGLYKHDLGVVQATEMLNKDIADYNYDDYLSDWYPAAPYIPMIAEYVKYIAFEMNLDHTRVIGMFSMADFQNITQQAENVANSNNPQLTLQNAIKRYTTELLEDQTLRASGEDNAIKKKLIIRSVGGEGSSVQVMNSQFDGKKHMEGLQSMISLIYKICGYSWSVSDMTGGSYENVSQTQQNNRSVVETTKEKNELFTRQWRKFLCKIFYVLFKKKVALDVLEEQFNEYVDFEIVSNVLVNEQNDWRKTMELKNNNLISTERAIKMLWPELSGKELREELERLGQMNMESKLGNPFYFTNTEKYEKMKKQNEALEKRNEKEFKKPKQLDNGAFNNQKPFGSKPFNKEGN